MQSVGRVHDDGKSPDSSAGATVDRSQIWIHTGPSPPRGPIDMHHFKKIQKPACYKAGQVSGISLVYLLCVH